jgi:hypothetical protein
MATKTSTAKKMGNGDERRCLRMVVLVKVCLGSLNGIWMIHEKTIRELINFCKVLHILFHNDDAMIS